jgi:diguanylate cyclase (GGDEF)-like protein
MLVVVGWWVLAMVSGLSWARQYTAALTAVTLLSALWTRAADLTASAGWVQLAVLGITPWLLAAQREREGEAFRRLHQEEAVQMSRLSSMARSLLSLQNAMQQMEAQIAEITDLYHVTKETSRALHLSELFAASLTIAPRLLNTKGLRLIDLSGPDPQFLRASRLPDGRMAAPDGKESNHESEMERAIIQQAVSTGRPSLATASDLACAFPEGLTRVAWAPLWREQQAVGVLVADELPEQQLKTLSIVANQLSLQCSRIFLYQQVEALAITDALTGIFVRGHFMDRAREELARSKRHGLSCTLLMADLDLFKQKNDTFGHLVGDVVLRDVARLLQRNLRDVDLIARFGGEEFILLLIETSAEQAMPVAQRLRQLVEIHPIRAYDELLTQTISIGAAGFPQHAQTLEQLIERADEALYAAKGAGRNRVVLYSEKLTSV